MPDNMSVELNAVDKVPKRFKVLEFRVYVSNNKHFCETEIS